MKRLRVVQLFRDRGGSGGESEAASEPDVTADPTPIWISKCTRTALILATLLLAGLVIWYVPSVLSTLVGGFALALVLSFPARWLSRLMPRGLAILLTFLIVAGLLVLAVLYLVPFAGRQIGALVDSFPSIANTATRYLRDALGLLQDRGLLPSDSEQVASTIKDRLKSAAQAIGKNEYLGGLVLVLLIQGAISTVGLLLLSVPYALALGALVSLTALIPYLGAWISAIPAVLVALTVSPTIAVLTALLYLTIQQLEGNFLTPKIQGDTLRVHPILVLLAVIIGGGLGGLVGVVVAVPSLAVLRVLFDFFRVRLKTEG